MKLLTYTYNLNRMRHDSRHVEKKIFIVFGKLVLKNLERVLKILKIKKNLGSWQH